MQDQSIGIGPTNELSLRVSVATLARVVFPRPGDGVQMLALEHKASGGSGDRQDQVSVKAQPFGGAVRILDIDHFLSHIGSFHFDSDRSRSEQDFRLYIQPTAWPKVQEYCLEHLEWGENSALETDPSREVEEEFEDTLGMQLRPTQYSVEPLKTIVENFPRNTTNVHAAGYPTVRVYKIFQVFIHDPSLFPLMITNSQMHPSQVLQHLAIKNMQETGKARANAILALPEEQVRTAYLSVPPEKRGWPLPFANTILEGNVAAVLEGIPVTKYWQQP